MVVADGSSDDEFEVGKRFYDFFCYFCVDETAEYFSVFVFFYNFFWFQRVIGYLCLWKRFSYFGLVFWFYFEEDYFVLS